MADRKPNKPRFVSDRPAGGHPLDYGALGDLVRQHPEEFIRRVDAMVAAGELCFSDVPSLPALFRALALVPVQAPVEIPGLGMRTITTSAFPLFVGSLAAQEINAAYEGVATVGQELVTERESNKKWIRVGAVMAEVPGARGVEEGHDFPLVGAHQGRFEIGSKRDGLMTRITQEMIEENDTDGVLEALQTLGRIPPELIEEQTLQRVFDINGSAATPAEPYTLRMNKVGTQLYNATANLPGTQAPSGTRINNNDLVDSTDLDAARERLATMRNDWNKRLAIPLSECQLVVPDSRLSVALKIMGSELEPGIANEQSNWGPRGPFRPKLVSTPKIDDLMAVTGAGTWLLGNCKKQFIRKWKIRLETVTVSGDLMEYARSRVAFVARVAWDVEVGARDYVWVVQCLPATTAPS